jgi:hypothetical protein
MSTKRVDDVKIGADPEMFLYSEKENKFVPVCGLIGGTKESPKAITTVGHAVQEDNVMVEYCIPPSTTKEEFINHIVFTKSYINDTLLRSLGLVSKCVASARFAIEDLQSDQAKLFGCSESYNAWDMSLNEVGKADETLRTAGGHIHIGYKNPSLDTSLEIIKAMDLFLGVPSILLDTDTERRKMYGKAGEHRLKPYGVEFRTLSTFWTNSEELIGWAFDSAMAAIQFVNDGGYITNPKDIIDCINHSDKELAREIIEDYNIVRKLAA